MKHFAKSFSVLCSTELKFLTKHHSQIKSIDIDYIDNDFNVIDSKKIGKIELIECISDDSSQAFIYKGLVKNSNKFYAVKKYFGLNGKDKDKINMYAIREYIYTSLLDHKNIICSYDIVKSSRYIYIIFEYTPNYDLYFYIDNYRLYTNPMNLIHFGGLPLNLVRWIFLELINTVNFIHSKGICHRDLKLENILISKNFEIKICDFGLSSTWSPYMYLSEPCGSLHYASPEILTTNGKYIGPEVDIWSCGVILYTLLFGKLPFLKNSNEHNKKTIARIKKSQYQIPDFLIRSDIDILLKSMLEPNPLKRASIAHILDNEWLNNFDKPFDVNSFKNILRVIRENRGLRSLSNRDILSNGIIDLVFQEPSSTSARSRGKVSPRNIKITPDLIRKNND